MNNARRKQIENLQEQLLEIKHAIENLQGDEQNAYDNLPYWLQESDKGERMYDAADNLGEAANSIEDAISYLDDAIA